ncbi:MAG: hypothetical protein KJ990_02390 [Proteobacteria bacterium]|nr:hypothetical protein [Pseudomonadota bacterium]MBU1649281.1 hypothetical protein [Pseudomonadota bacterium]
MPDVYLNPYPGAEVDIEIGKEKFLATAEALYELRDNFRFFYNPAVDTPIRAFTLIRDAETKATYRIQDIIFRLSGRQKEIARAFLDFFSRGQKLTEEHLQHCEDWELSCLKAPAPILELALRNEGMVTTIATEKEWEIDFIEFTQTDKLLPNIWGQNNLEKIKQWIISWNETNLANLQLLEEIYNVLICDGAMDNYLPTHSEWPTIFKMFKKASASNFIHDGYQIKDVDSSSFGVLKQLKHLGSGLRVYVTPHDSKLLLGGFYKKGQGNHQDAQNKAIKKAMKRIEKFLAT